MIMFQRFFFLRKVQSDQQDTNQTENLTSLDIIA